MRGTASSDAPEGEAAPLHSIMRSDGRSGKELQVKYREGENSGLDNALFPGDSSGINLGIVVAGGKRLYDSGDRFKTQALWH
jgi:hypothetical protein